MPDEKWKTLMATVPFDTNGMSLDDVMRKLVRGYHGTPMDAPAGGGVKPLSAADFGNAPAEPHPGDLGNDQVVMAPPSPAHAPGRYTALPEPQLPPGMIPGARHPAALPRSPSGMGRVDVATEGPTPNPDDFQPSIYGELNPDLKRHWDENPDVQAFYGDYETFLREHYRMAGSREGRPYRMRVRPMPGLGRYARYAQERRRGPEE